MIRKNKTWLNTNSIEMINDNKCVNSYSGEHSFIPHGNYLKCLHCGKTFKQRETY